MAQDLIFLGKLLHMVTASAKYSWLSVVTTLAGLSLLGPRKSIFLSGPHREPRGRMKGSDNQKMVPFSLQVSSTLSGSCEITKQQENGTHSV